MGVKMSKNKHARASKKNMKEIVIREKSQPKGGEYYDEPPADKSGENDSTGDAEKKKRAKLIKRTVVVVLLAVLLVLVWANRYNLTPENLSNWVKTKVFGTGLGDGYPIDLVGSNAAVGNFLSYDGNCVVLSDTALNITNSTGKEILSSRHSYSNPNIRRNGNKFLLYDCGGLGYSIISANNDVHKYTGTYKITAGDITGKGRYALLTQPEDYSSQLDIMDEKDEVIFTYKFAEGYATALALNSDGTLCAVATVFTNLGEMYTKIEVLSTSNEKPVAEYTMNGNFVSKIYWSGNNIYAVGDTSMAVCGISLEFKEYSYEGKQLTAVAAMNGSAFVSISGYSRSGASTLLVFSGSSTPVVVDLDGRIEDISSYGSVVGVLINHKIYSFDIASGKALGTADAGYDAEALSMLNERNAYVLGAREVREVSLVE